MLCQKQAIHMMSSSNQVIIQLLVDSSADDGIVQCIPK